MGLFARKLLGPLLGGGRSFIAVDFDSRHLRIVQADHAAGQTKIRKLTQVEMPRDVDISDPNALGVFLAGTLKKLRLSGAGVLMNVPRGQAMLKPMTLPPGTAKEELAGMVRFQVEKELAYPAEEAVIDFTTTSHFDVGASQEGVAPGVSVLAGVVKRPVVEHYRRIAESAQVRLLRLGLRPYAAMRCVDACTTRRDSEAVAIVFLTADETEISILAGNSLAFSRSAVVSIAPPTGGSDPAVKETVDSLVTEIARSLQSYQTVQGAGKIDAVLLAGGTDVEGRVAARLAQRIRARCETFDPSGALGLRQSSPGTSAFIAALGLAIAHRGTALPFDFLAPKKPRVRRDRRKLRAAGIAAGAAAVLTATVLLASAHLAEKKNRVGKLRSQHQKLEKKYKSVRALARRCEVIEKWEASGRNWLDHWANLCGLFPSCREIYIDRLKTNRNDGSISFTVKAANPDAIDTLSANLTKAGYEFRRGTSITADINKKEYRHSTDMKVIVPEEMEVDLSAINPAPRPGDDVSLEKWRPGRSLPGYAPAKRPAGEAGGQEPPKATPAEAEAEKTDATEAAKKEKPPEPDDDGLTEAEREKLREFLARQEKYYKRSLLKRRAKEDTRRKELLRRRKKEPKR